jgi:hypothetical protein
MFGDEFRFKENANICPPLKDQTIPWLTWPAALTIIRGKAT